MDVEAKKVEGEPKKRTVSADPVSRKSEVFLPVTSLSDTVLPTHSVSQTSGLSVTPCGYNWSQEKRNKLRFFDDGTMSYFW